MRDRQPQVLVRVHWRFVDADFVVEVRPGRASAEADVPNRIATVYVLPGGNRVARKVSVARRDSMSVIDNNGTPVSAHEVGERNLPVSWGNHRRADDRGNVYAGVERAFAVERINALAK